MPSPWVSRYSRHVLGAPTGSISSSETWPRLKKANLARAVEGVGLVILALCLSREEPRQFYLNRCQNVRLAPAAEFLMPVEMVG